MSIRVRRKDDHNCQGWFSDYNYFGLGEFIAQFDEGDASSEYTSEWEPFDQTTDTTLPWPPDKYDYDAE